MVPLDTIYLIHHSHTDIGFTGDQPIVWELHARFIDQALSLIEQTEDYPTESAFRWTLETTAPLQYWLRYASDPDIERFIRAEQTGRLEVTAMWLNLTPLCDSIQYLESLQPVHQLRRDYGFTIRSAMNCDVNGHNWPLADLLIDAGVEGFSMAINHHFGGAPDPRPWPFWWQAPSGRRLLAYNGWAYSLGRELGMGDPTPDRFLEWLSRIQAHLQRIHYPLSFLLMHGDNPFGDNGTAFRGYANFVQRWNDADRVPRIVFATPRMFWEQVKAHAHQLTVWRGDWTDYWNFGALSTARETAIDRANRTRLINADTLYAAKHALGCTPLDSDMIQTQWAGRSFQRYRREAWQALNLWAEHTWAADCGVVAPEMDDSLSSKSHKFDAVYTARSLSLLLQRDALADFSQHVERQSLDDLLVFNPLAWPRTLSGPVSYLTLEPRGDPADTTASRHFQGHYNWPTQICTPRPKVHLGGHLGNWLPPIDVPAFGYVTVPKSVIVNVKEIPASDQAVIENHRYRLTFERERGGLVSLYDKQLNCEWVDQTAGYPLHGFVHEEVTDRSHPSPRLLINNMDWTPTVENTHAWQSSWQATRTQPKRVLWHKVYRLPFGTAVEQELEHPKIGSFVQRLFLPDYADHIDCQSEWEMGLDTHPQATYLVFPFDLPNATPRFSVGGQLIQPEVDQLNGVCRDYFTTQGIVDFSNGERGITITLPENPLVQLGNFHFGQHQTACQLERPMLLSWVTNNYWEVNFQPHQPGLVVTRHRLLPYRGPFNESRALRLGAEAAQADPLIQHMGEPKAISPALPAQGTLLNLPLPPVLTLHVRAGVEAGRMLLRLVNASDQIQLAHLRSALLGIEQAWLCNLFDEPVRELSVTRSSVEVELAPRQVVVLCLSLKAV